MIVLASNSPRRRQMLAWMEVPFTTTMASIDETPRAGENPSAYASRLAQEKARACERQAPFNALILAADTTVADGSQIIGKPLNADDAARMLRQLSSRHHMVHTAIVLALPSRGISELELCSTRVKMRAYTEEEIVNYIESGDPLDKAGAYAIQNETFNPVEKISGCYASVMGLPLCHIERALRRLGFGVRKRVPYRCQKELAYACPVFKRILAGENVG